tara:strand:+ start:602 stop:1333 length:732 start_codon:yes stop_codon:yes gene_type:complete
MSKLTFFFLIVILVVSCGVKKTSTTYNYNSPKEIEEIIAIVEKNNYSTWDWMTIKGQLDITQQDRKINVRINIKSKKDSVIWASARGPFGVELIRGKITQDSVYFINRINKTYFIKPIDAIFQGVKLGITFYDIQEFLTASPKISPRNFTLNLVNEGFYLKSTNSNYFINKNYMLENIVKTRKKFSLEYKFNDDQKIGFNRRMLVLTHEGKKYFQMILDSSKIEFTKPKAILFEIPESYNEEK